MYSLDQKRRAVELYVRYDKSCAAVINELGYPSRARLRTWHAEYVEHGGVLPAHSHGRYTEEQRRIAVSHYLTHGRCNARTRRALGYPGCYQVLADWVDELAPARRRSSLPRPVTADGMADAVVSLVTRKGSAAEVAQAYGVTRDILYGWKYRLLGKEVPCAMADGDDPPNDPDELRGLVRSLRREVKQLEPGRDVLEGTIEILGKGPGADPNRPANREKATLAEALRSRHRLKDLLEALRMARSSYQYQVGAMRTPDRYAGTRARINDLFRASGGVYGYRRVHACLRSEGVAISEKVCARIMREEGLVARTSARRLRYSSYRGEISRAPENLVGRDFRAATPNELWLTDVTELRIPAGKIYLSPVVDCYDGMVVSWVTSTSPDAKMANSMLRAAVGTLAAGERPTIRSDRGGHYRWPGWVEICEREGLTRSMSRKGCCPDNSAMEGFFGRTRVEMFYGRDWSGVSIDAFMDVVDGYMHWYNEGRIKMSLGCRSPLDYRRAMGFAA